MQIYIFSKYMSTNTHVPMVSHHSHPCSLIGRWLWIYLMLAIVNTIAFPPIATFMTLLLIQLRNCKVHKPGIVFVTQTKFISSY